MFSYEKINSHWLDICHYKETTYLWFSVRVRLFFFFFYQKERGNRQIQKKIEKKY